MTLIGYISDEDFMADFPVDFGKGIRGSYLAHRNKRSGIIVCHRLTGDLGCATSVMWRKVDDRPIHTKANDDPLTIEESIRCDCGLHGWIREGQWEHAHNSIQ